MKQADPKYNALDAAAKAKVDDALRSYLATEFPDKIVVIVEYRAEPEENDKALANYWQGQTLDTLKNTVFLSGPDGDRIAPIAAIRTIDSSLWAQDSG